MDNGGIIDYKALVKWSTTRQLKHWEKICPSATSFTTNPTWIDLGSNPSLHSQKLAINCLSCGTSLDAVQFSLFMPLWNFGPQTILVAVWHIRGKINMWPNLSTPVGLHSGMQVNIMTITVHTPANTKGSQAPTFFTCHQWQQCLQNISGDSHVNLLPTIMTTKNYFP